MFTATSNANAPKQIESCYFPEGKKKANLLLDKGLKLLPKDLGTIMLSNFIAVPAVFAGVFWAKELQSSNTI